MSYMDIDNLYKNTDILMFKECYAMEKIHGTSAHISYKGGRVSFFAGGSKYEDFVKLFNEEDLKKKLDEMIDGTTSVHVYGEAYGGNMQKMRETYGNELKFVAFEVKIGDLWLNVPKAEQFVKELGLDFVPYVRISTNMKEIDEALYTPSVQALKNGIQEEKMREGIVLRPIEEVVKNNGKRVIAKHKRPEFAETKTPRTMDADKLKVLSEADAIASEWATEMRLTHVLDNFPNPSIENTGEVIKAMLADILKESTGEIVDSKEARKAIGKQTAILFKRYLNESINRAEEN